MDYHMNTMDEESSSDESVSAMLISDPYYRKYLALKQRCQSVYQENQRLVSRVYHVQRLVRRARRQCHLVAARLDQHGDDYREAALRASAEGWPDAAAAGAGEGGEAGRPRPADTAHTPVPKSRLKPAKKPKRRLNEPKKPSNPFFQYCQEQRGRMLLQMKGQSPGGLSKASVTKQLAANWSRMTAQHKQKYVDRYEHDKRQYTLAVQKLQRGDVSQAGGSAPR